MLDSELTKRAFGHPILDEWVLDKNIIYINHGSYGAAPRRMRPVRRWQDTSVPTPGT